METAIADIIDNSITAGAIQVDIFHACEDSNPQLAIIDNGKGMTPDELVEAMRAGGRNGPIGVRSQGDMGRFGLGLKTASFSQCRRLTVVSRKNGMVSAACWDLDEISDTWSLILFDSNELSAIPMINEIPLESGTMVLWEKMDRVQSFSLSILRICDYFLERIEAVRSHIGLVFHRFIEKQHGGASLDIRINRRPVSALDPYFRDYTATQKLETEFITIRGCLVEVRAFIIPHSSKLRAADRVSLQTQGGAAGTQGFYVYRNRRLLAWGDWFRLRRAKTEASGLARVMIDIPNALDDLWGLDIKKSSVSPPETVRHELRRIIERITDCSTRTYTSRGQRLAERRYALWQRINNNEGISYVLDRNHPLLTSFTQTLTEESCCQFNSILMLIEKTIPVEAIHNDSLGGNEIEFHRDGDDDTAARYALLACLMRNQGISDEKIAEVMVALGMSKRE